MAFSGFPARMLLAAHMPEIAPGASPVSSQMLARFEYASRVNRDGQDRTNPLNRLVKTLNILPTSSCASGTL